MKLAEIVDILFAARLPALTKATLEKLGYRSPKAG